MTVYVVCCPSIVNDSHDSLVLGIFVIFNRFIKRKSDHDKDIMAIITTLGATANNIRETDSSGKINDVDE
jgi:hypothetical protein